MPFSGRQLESVNGSVRVIYVVGSGRSGSTVLDTILGSHPEAIGVGELGGMHRAVCVNNEFCACGQPGQDCEFWSAVLANWRQRTKCGDAGEFLARQQRYEWLGVRQMLRLVRQRAWPSRDFAEFLDQTGKLYAAIADVSESDVVIDSSKNPLRAFVLSLIPTIDLRLVHLVRDGRAVAWSVKKPFQKDAAAGVHAELPSQPVWRTMRYWAAVNMLASWVRRNCTTSSVLVRYEDLMRDPEFVLHRIGRTTGLDLCDVAADVLAGLPLPVGHTIAGNRLRMAGSVRLKPDWQWTEKLSAHDRRVCWWLAGWLLRQYGYPHTVSEAVEAERQSEVFPGARKAA